MRGSHQDFRAAQLSLTCRRTKYLPHAVSVRRISSIATSQMTDPSPEAIAKDHATSALRPSSTGSINTKISGLRQIKDTAAIWDDASIDLDEAQQVDNENISIFDEKVVEEEDLTMCEERALAAVSEEPSGGGAEAKQVDVSTISSPSLIPPPPPPPQSRSPSASPLSLPNEDQEEIVQGGGRYGRDGDQQAAPMTPIPAVILEDTGRAGLSAGREEVDCVGERKSTGDTKMPATEEGGTEQPNRNDDSRSKERRSRRPPPIVTKDSPLDVLTKKTQPAADGVKTPDECSKSPGACERESTRGCFVAKTFSPSDLGLGEGPNKAQRGSQFLEKESGKDEGDHIAMWATLSQGWRNSWRNSSIRRGTAEEVSLCHTYPGGE